MFYAYVLHSSSLNKYYVGSTQNIEKRIHHHNMGLDRWSKRGIPWTLVYVEECPTRSQAMKREKFLKTGQGRVLYR